MMDAGVMGTMGVMGCWLLVDGWGEVAVAPVESSIRALETA